MRVKHLFVLILLVPVILGACGPTGQPAVAGSGGAGTAYAQSSIVPPVYSSYTPGLTVVGTGKVEADPDVVYLTLGVDLKRDDAAAVMADAGRKMESILAALQAAGVAEADIRTASYYLWVEQRYDPQTGQPTGVIDYHLTHTVRVTLRDLAKVGTLLSAAVEAGANTVSEVSFSLADPDALATQARQKAIADAQKRAQEMAQAMGVTLGKVLSVSESGGYVPAADYYGKGGMELAQAAVPMPAGSFSVSISVVVVYELP